MIKAVTFHVTSYLDLWRLFLADGGRHARISRLAPFIPIDYTRGWINWNRYSAVGISAFPLWDRNIVHIVHWLRGDYRFIVEGCSMNANEFE